MWGGKNSGSQFLFSSLVHLIAGDNIIANIAVFKIINLLFTITTVFIVKNLLEETAPSRLVFGLAIFSWNPLLHIEIIGNAHNDIIMAFFASLGLYLVFKKRESWGAFALALAVLAKIAALLYVPLIAIWLASTNRKVAYSGRLCAALSVAKYYDSVKPPTKNLALNLNAKFIPELGMGHGVKRDGRSGETSETGAAGSWQIAAGRKQ